MSIVFTEKKEEDKQAGGQGSLTDFHQLLLLRLLRPDRFPVAMATYVSKHLRYGNTIYM